MGLKENSWDSRMVRWIFLSFCQGHLSWVTANLSINNWNAAQLDKMESLKINILTAFKFYGFGVEVLILKNQQNIIYNA